MLFDLCTAMTPFLIMIVIYFYYRLNKLEKYLVSRRKNINKKMDQYDEELRKIHERLEEEPSIEDAEIVSDNEEAKE